LKSKSKLDKWFLLTWKKICLIIISWFVAVILHNFVYGIFKKYYDARGGDEAFFFIIAIIIIPIYFIFSITYSLFWLIKRKKKHK